MSADQRLMSLDKWLMSMDRSAESVAARPASVDQSAGFRGPPLHHDPQELLPVGCRAGGFGPQSKTATDFTRANTCAPGFSSRWALDLRVIRASSIGSSPSSERLKRTMQSDAE
jgi:hypothetical protein